MRMADFPILAEIKYEYVQHRRDGHNRAKATQMVLDSYKNELTLGVEDDGLFVWVGLADAQLYHKELTKEVAEKASDAVDKLADLDWQICARDLLRRKENYALAPMPEKKVGKARPPFRCPWEIGDTFAYRLSGLDAEECGIEGQYALLRKVDDIVFDRKYVLPVVTVSIWEQDPLPVTSSEFCKVPILKLEVGGRNFSSREKFEYRTELLIKNRKQLNSLSLKYLGNFLDVPLPDDEIIFADAGSMLMTLPHMIDEELCEYYRINQRILSGEKIPSAAVAIEGFFRFMNAVSNHPYADSNQDVDSIVKDIKNA